MDDATLLVWIDRGRTLSFALVAVGVVGEFLVDRVSGPIIKRRDDAQRAEIARLNKEAGDARQGAGEAIERAAKLEKQGAELKAEAEKERLARVKIEERLAARTISPEQAAKLKSALLPLKGKSLGVQFISGSPEIAGYADLLAKILTDSGLVVNKSPVIIIGNVQPGLSLSIGKNRMTEANMLANALVFAGLAEKPMPAQELTEPAQLDTLGLMIGPK